MNDITIINTSYSVSPASLPFGVLMIVSVLEKAGYRVGFLDYQTHDSQDKTNPEEFSRFLEQADAPILGLSVLSSQLPTVLLGVEAYKARHPEATIIFGGPSATDTPDAILAHFPVDIVVRGEGEITVVELMHCLEQRGNLADVKGISYREGTRIVTTPDRERIQDLDSLPMPAYHRVDWNRYRNTLGIVTSRGCPYRCRFCSAHSIWQHAVTYRSPASLAREIASVKPYISNIEFHDDTLVLQRPRVKALMDALKAEGVDTPWYGYGRVNLMDDELLRTLAEGNCTELFYGLESGSNRVLKTLKKGFTIEQAIAVVQKTRKYIPSVITSFIYGFPFETMEDFYDTLWAINQLGRDPHVIPNVWFLCPLPKAPLTEEYRHALRFSEEYQSLFGTLQIRGSVSDYPTLVDAIRRFPDVFATFYYFDHAELAEKWSIMLRMRQQALAAHAPGN